MSDVDEKAAAARLDEGYRVPLAKVRVLGQRGAPDVPPSNVTTEDPNQWANIGTLLPPYDPAALVRLYEHSNALRQNVDAYATNVDAFGHRLEPVIDLDSTDAFDRVKNALEQDKRLQAERGELPGSWEVSDEDVEAALDGIETEMRRERARLESFFGSCCLDMSFTTLRRRTRQDIEVTGNGYWEVLRNGGGALAQFTYIPAFTMRLMPQDVEPVVVTQQVRVTDLHFQPVQVPRRFRRFVQLYEGRYVYFKEFGDPRVISRKSGQVFPSVEALKAADAQDGPATEVLHFKVHSARSPYGVPRWIGVLLAVLGSRYAEEVNYLYFENKSVPPLAILVSGGRLSEEAVQRLESLIETEIRGKNNFHKVMVLDAEAAGGGDFASTGRMKIDLKPLTGAQHNDALFQQYDERNVDKVGFAFRLPRLLRGDARDFNRATADATLAFAETQVFGPEREEFDSLLNRAILSEMRARFWRFKSNGPTLSDPMALAPIIASMVSTGVLTPEEGRQLSESVFHREFVRIEEAWTKQPIQLTLAGLQGGGGMEGEGEPPEEAAPQAPPASPAPTGPALVPGQAKADMTTADLAAGGLLQPAQGGPRRRWRDRKVGNGYFLAEANRLLKLRAALLQLERRAADDAAFQAARASGGRRK